MSEVTSAKELGKLMKAGQSRIKISIDLAKKKIIVEGIGAVAWIVALGGLGFLIYGAITTAAAPPAAPLSGPISFTGGGVAVSILGASTVSCLVAIGIGGGGIGAVKLFKKGYKLRKEDNQYVLVKVKDS